MYLHRTKNVFNNFIGIHVNRTAARRLRLPCTGNMQARPLQSPLPLWCSLPLNPPWWGWSVTRGSAIRFVGLDELLLVLRSVFRPFSWRISFFFDLLNHSSDSSYVAHNERPIPTCAEHCPHSRGCLRPMAH